MQTASERIREARQRAEIERAFNSARTAYPEAGVAQHVREAAKAARVSIGRATVALGFTESEAVTDWRDYDPNRWNLH